MYEQIKDIPKTRDGKMLYGILAALVAGNMLNEALALWSENTPRSVIELFGCAVLLFTVVLAMVRFNTGRPLFEPLKQRH